MTTAEERRVMGRLKKVGGRLGQEGWVDGRQNIEGEEEDSTDAPRGSRVELRGGKSRTEY